MTRVTPGPTRGERLSRRISLVAASYAFLGGLCSFLGWALNVPRLTHWLGRGIAIQPNTCVLIIISVTDSG
jgi:hypothetical protein